MPDVLFLCDAGPHVGGGHVMRCLTLARALAAEGVASTFLAPPAVGDILEAFGETHRHPVPAAAAEGPQALSAAAAAALDGGSYAAVVVDHYGMSAREEEALAGPGRLLAVIDDLADRPHLADLLVDTGYGREAAAYGALVPEGAQLLLGPDYALVRPEFAASRAEALARRSGAPVRRVLVSLGLTDVGGITGRVLRLLDGRPGEICFDVVVGGGAPSLPELRERAARDPRLTLHVETAEMAALTTAADLAVGAGGSSTWERACLGLPTLALVLADNQAELAGRLAAAGAALAVEARDEDFGGAFRESYARLVQDAELRARLSRTSAALCDGGGAARVAAALRDRLGTASKDGRLPAPMAAEVHIRLAQPEDAEAVWRCRNDGDSRAASRNTAEVAWPEHQAWFSRALTDPARVLLIGVETGSDRKVGLVRFDTLENGERLVGVNVAPEQRGRGLSAPLLAAGIARLSSPAQLVAEVRRDNVASLRLFEGLGFRRREESGDFIVFEREV